MTCKLAYFISRNHHVGAQARGFLKVSHSILAMQYICHLDAATRLLYLGHVNEDGDPSGPCLELEHAGGPCSLYICRRVIAGSVLSRVLCQSAKIGFGHRRGKTSPVFAFSGADASRVIPAPG